MAILIFLPSVMILIFLLISLLNNDEYDIEKDTKANKEKLKRVMEFVDQHSKN